MSASSSSSEDLEKEFTVIQSSHQIKYAPKSKGKKVTALNIQGTEGLSPGTGKKSARKPRTPKGEGKHSHHGDHSESPGSARRRKPSDTHTPKEESTPKGEGKHSHRPDHPSPGTARTALPPIPQEADPEGAIPSIAVADSARRSVILDEEPPGELSLDDILTVSNIQGTPEEQSRTILNLFNYDVKKKQSCFAYKVLPGRAMSRVPPNCFLMGHRNQKTELSDPQGKRVALQIVPDPTVIVETLGTYEKTEPFYGEFGKYVLNVPAGYYAKAKSKNEPVLFSEGPHVIIDSTFQFEPDSGFVSQNEPYIRHLTLHILRIPAGKIAKVWVGTEPRILESRREPYVFNDAVFELQPSSPGSFFFDATTQYVEHGSLKRIIPHTGEVGIGYINGILRIIHPDKDFRPTLINSPTFQFDSFISTSLQTCLFPSEETKRLYQKDHHHAAPDEVNYKIFQTRDSLSIGIIIVVAFSVSNPEVAITKLGRDGIIPHLENVSFADMGKVIQLSSLQEVMLSSQKIGTGAQSFQDQVKSSLKKDLKEYGIQLNRLNIESMTVMDKGISKQLAEKSTLNAELTTQQAQLVKKYDIKLTKARLKADIANIRLTQKNQALISSADSVLLAAKLNAQAILIQAEAKQKAEAMQGEVYLKYPKLLELELAKLHWSVLEKATVFITSSDGDISSNSGLISMV